MPFNYLGDLYKFEVVDRLNKRGCNIKNVHALNLILEEMGLLRHSGNQWITTEEAVKYTIYTSQMANVNAWHPNIVDVVYDYLKNK